MTRHILILGNNLTGLVTAYRLLQYGFHISIVDTQHHVEPTTHSGAPLDFIQQSSSLPSLRTCDSLPLVLHGFYHATWAFLQELSFAWPIPMLQSVSLEFGNTGKKPITLPKLSRLTWLHPLIRFTFFKGLSWPDRWNVINFLEKQWEDNLLPNHNPDKENVKTWLISAKQSAHSRSHFWNPLCRFFLSCDLSEVSLGSFFDVFSRYWFGQSINAETFLAPPETLAKLETDLRQWLLNKGVRIYTAQAKLLLHTDPKGIQAIELGNQHFNAQIYVSALTPRNLLSLLPERALARYSYFSSLSHIPEVHGLAIQFTLHDRLLPSRVILHLASFDWITSQPSPQSTKPKTIITCVKLQASMKQEHSEQWHIDNAWASIQHFFNLSPTHTQESCEPQFCRDVGPFFPCHRGVRTHRPLPTTPIPNFFLAGPWTATKLPASLESTITSANACAKAVATSFYGFSH